MFEMKLSDSDPSSDTSHDKSTSLKSRDISSLLKIPSIPFVGALFIIIISIVLSFSSSLWVYMVLGGALGCIGAASVIFKFWSSKSNRRHPAPILLHRSYVNFLLGALFMIYPLWSLRFCGELTCNANQVADSNCSVMSLLLQFLEVAGEGWFLCVAIDLHRSLSNPFACFKRNFVYYICLAFGLALVSTIIMLALHKQTIGVVYIDTVANEPSICWFKTSGSTSFTDLNLSAWLLFYSFIIIIYLYSIFTAVLCYRRLRAGISDTFHSRLLVIVNNFITVFGFVLYWTVVFAFYTSLFSYARQNRNHDDGDMGSPSQRRTFYFLIFLLASKGYGDAVVTSLFFCCEKDEDDGKNKAQLNEGLREEFLTYLTSGVCNSLLFSAFVHGNDEEESVEIALVTKKSTQPGFISWSYLFDQLLALSKINNFLTTTTSTRSVAMLKQGSERHEYTFLEGKLTVNNRSSSRRSLTRLSIEERNSLTRKSDLVNDKTSLKDTFLASTSNSFIEGFDSAIDWFERGMKIMSSSKKQTIETSTFSDVIMFIDYLPLTFAKIRHAFNITDEAYLDSFRSTIKERLTEGGASGAFFFYSGDERYIAKSCTKQEIETLRRVCRAYAAHVTKHPNTLLISIFGAHCLKIYNHEFYFLVMGNLFTTTPSQLYDLKGSWVNRSSKPPENGKEATCRKCNLKFIYNRKGTVSRDNPCRESGNGLHKPNRVFKDNELNFKLRLSSTAAKELLMQLDRDSLLLASMNIMDYSLLLGVEFDTFCVEKQPSDPAVPCRLRRASVKREFNDVNVMADDARVVYANRVTGPSHFKLALIDLLQEYDTSKILEREYKIRLGGADGDGLSSIDAERYRSRFMKKMIEIIQVSRDESDGKVIMDDDEDEEENKNSMSSSQNKSSNKLNLDDADDFILVNTV